MRWLAFVLIVALASGLFAFARWVGPEFCYGTVFGAVMYVLAARIRHGFWVEP